MGSLARICLALLPLCPPALFALFFFFLVIAASASARPNVVLITIDTLRADHLGCYGYKKNTSPTIDQMAATGLRFQNAYSAVPMTLPSHATILTGVYPNKHGYHDNAFFPPTSYTLISESLKQHGYHTAAFISGAPLSARYGLNRGFDYYDDEFLEQYKTADETTAGALQWLKKAEAPYFLWVHYYDPHAPYDPPQPFQQRFPGGPYDGEIAFVDNEIAKLWKAVGKQAVIVLTADHGESLGEHGESTHAVFIYDATLRVPLILLGPAIKPGVRSDLATLCDIAPTILELAGVIKSNDFDGVSLLSEPANRTLFAESLYAQRNFGYAPIFAGIREQEKYILAPQPEFYNLKSDPNERRNLIKESDAKELAKKTEQYSKTMVEVHESPLPPEELEKLRSLGYIGASQKGSDIDPKSKIHIIEELNEGMVFMYSHKYLLAEQKFREVLRMDQANSLSFRFLGDALSAEGKYAEAAKAYSDSLRILPQAEVTVQLAKAYNRLNKTQEAEKTLKEAVRNYPDYYEATFELASLYGAARKWSAAEALLGKDLPEFANQRGILYLQKNEPQNAAPEFLKAVESQSKATYWNNLGIAYQQLNQPAQAEKAYRKGMALSPDYRELEANLSFLLVQTQQWDQAYVHLEHVTSLNPQLWGARFALGFVLENQNKKKEAAAVYEKLLQDAPKDWPQRSKAEARLKELQRN